MSSIGKPRPKSGLQYVGVALSKDCRVGVWSPLFDSEYPYYTVRFIDFVDYAPTFDLDATQVSQLSVQ